jgi:predicted dehydrogenase
LRRVYRKSKIVNQKLLHFPAFDVINSSMTTKRIQISRRSFLKSCAVTAAATGLPAWFLERELALAQPAATTSSPNDRPAIALIGCGGQGRWDAKNASRLADIVALCDVDENHLRDAAQQFTADGKTPAKFSDFRKLLERDDIHAVIVATPDHWHTLVNLAAVKAGKDVYGEKPLTLTIDEGKHIVQAVRDKKAVLQTGTQQRSDRRFHLACELVRNGRLGKLKEIEVWLPAGLREGPFSSSPVPTELNWDFWLGQTPKVDYVRQRCHTNFRFWYDYSGGTMTDWGAHHNDIARWAIGADGPTAVEGKALIQPIPGGYTAFSEYEVQYTYANGVIHTVRTTRDDTIYGTAVNEKGQHNGVKFIGSDGWIWVNRNEIDASNEDLVSTPLPDNAQRLYNSSDHMENFFDCVRSRKKPAADVEIGHRSASLCHMGVIALRVGQKLNWDPQAQEFVGENAAIANPYVTRAMRPPYDYSFVA